MRNQIKKLTKNIKLRNRLLISYIIVCLFPLMTVSVVIYNYAVDSMEESAMEFASVFNSQIVTSIDHFIEECDRVTKSVLVDNDVLVGIQKQDELTIAEQVNQQLYINRIMLRVRTLAPDIQDVIFITNNQKVYLSSSTGDSVKQEILFEEEWLKKMYDSESVLSISAAHDRSYYYSRQDGTVITVGRKILDFSGAEMGILLLELDPAQLLELNESFIQARNRYDIKMLVRDSEGAVLYDSDITTGKLSWEEVFVATYQFEKNPEDFILLSRTSEQGGLYVNTVIPREKLLEKIDGIKLLTIFTFSGSILLLVILSVTLSHAITRPIKSLQQSMKAVESGRYQSINEHEAGAEIGSLIHSYNSMIGTIKSLIEDVYVGEIKEKNAKLLALQTQINPHMLYNTLESIRMKALLAGEDEIADMIKILSKMFKVALSVQNEESRIDKEIEYAKNYLKLQNMRYKDQFLLEVDVSQDIMQKPIMAMIFQPILENCIEHGFRGYDTILHIKLTGRETEPGELLFYVRDDGKGMSEEKIREVNQIITIAESDKSVVDKISQKGRSSIGLKNIAERIKLYYGDASYLKIYTDQMKKTVVEIKIMGKESKNEKAI